MQSSKKTDWGEAPFTVQNETAPAFNITVKGRDRWALECLIASGRNGCTSIDHPGPRWSSYVHKLRGLGVLIGTNHETHKGDFPGNHARYCLISVVVHGSANEVAA